MQHGPRDSDGAQPWACIHKAVYSHRAVYSHTAVHLQDGGGHPPMLS